jgi:hypothetical protein
MGKIVGSFREGLQAGNMKQIFKHEKDIYVVPVFILGRSSAR